MSQDVTQVAPVPAIPSEVAAIIQGRLSEVAGSGLRAVSLSLDFGPAWGSAEVGRLEAWVDRRTRTLAFVRARLTASDGRMIAVGSGVFSLPAA